MDSKNCYNLFDMENEAEALKKLFQSHSLVLYFLLTVVLTPWFWFLSPPKNFFNSELKKDVQEARDEVIWERGEVGNSSTDKLFSNWPVVFIRRRLVIVMENLDIGNYFFAGHPRARIGVEERQKFFLFQFLLFLIGFLNQKIKKYARFLLSYSLIILLADLIFKWRGYDETILFSTPFLILIPLGMEKISHWPKKFLVSFITLAFLEMTAFIIFFSQGLLK